MGDSVGLALRLRPSLLASQFCYYPALFCIPSLDLCFVSLFCPCY